MNARRPGPVLLLAIAATLGLATGSWARGAGPRHDSREREKAMHMSHVRFLSAPELRGRKAGSPQADIAARYLAEQFRSLGLEPLPGAPDYLQDVTWTAQGDSGSASEATPQHSANVVGLVRGTDRSRAQEVILVCAHYDGQGVLREGNGETVLPGARDNAMGVAALLAAARSLAGKPGARSVLFLASTAEEPGMAGTRFFADHPPLPLERLAFVLNNDGGGVYEPSRWCIGGLERTTAEPLLRRCGERCGLATLPYPEPYRGLYEEGDSVSFARKGIPALTVSPGFRVVDERVLRTVHQPADRVDATFDENYLEKFCRAFACLVQEFANAGKLPSWQPGDPFAPGAPGTRTP